MVLFWLTFMSKMPLISILLPLELTTLSEITELQCSEAKVRSEMELIVLGIAEGLTFVD